LDNAGDAAAIAKPLKEKGVSMQAYYLQPAEKIEAQIENVRVPPEITLKEPFLLEIVTRSNQNMPGLLQIFRNGELLQEGTIALNREEKLLIRIPQKITAPGMYRYDVRIKPEQDFQAENNFAQAWISVEGPPRILLVDEEPTQLQSLASDFKQRGFSVEVKEGRYLPRTLEDMLLYQAILIRNVPASTIQSQMPLIQQYVHEFGGGFAMLGGTKSFGPGGYYQTPVETVLPVRMDLVNKKYLADVAMVIVIDKSGSMTFADRGRQKIDLADEGGARVASLLKDTDQLGVLAVDSVAKWAYPVRKLHKKQEAIDAILSIRAGGGGIYVYSGLHEAYEALRNLKSSVKHVILFADTADCEEKDGPNGESSLNLAARVLQQDQITTTTIGIGQSGDSDVAFLEQLATIAGGRFYFTNDMFTLPQIFAQESAVVQRHYITEETFTPKITQTEPVLNGLEAVPDLDGYVATSAKPLANVSLISHREDPVLAFWRHGLGQTLAYTSDPASHWSAKWQSWADWERFWAQTGRYLARTSQPGNFQVSARFDGDNTTIIVDAFDEASLSETSWQGALIDSSDKEHRLNFLRTSYGRFEASIPSSGSLFGKVFRLHNGQIAEETIVQFSAPANREYDLSGDGRERLLELTGNVVTSSDQLQFQTRIATDIQPIRSQLILWAIWLFLLDVALRKLDISMLRRRKVLQPAPVPIPVPLQQLKVRKSEIEKHRPVQVTIPVNDQMPVQEPPAPQPPVVQEDSDYMKRLKEAKKRRKD
jgi:uncharacterized membrane protein